MVCQVGEFPFPMKKRQHQHKRNDALGYLAVLSYLFSLCVTYTFSSMAHNSQHLVYSSCVYNALYA